MTGQIQSLLNQNKRMLAVLIDPDKATPVHLEQLLTPENQSQIDFLLVGGSVLTSGNIDDTLTEIQKLSKLPTVLFPGSPDQISSKADAILLLSLISGRNADLLIGKHVESSLRLKQSGLEILPTGYILVDGGSATTVSYISGTQPIPSNKTGLAAVTALAGEQLGLCITYMDAGSGANQPIPVDMIKQVRSHVTSPIIVGGGIRTSEKAKAAWDAGANLVVIGNKLEEDPDFLKTLEKR